MRRTAVGSSLTRRTTPTTPATAEQQRSRSSDEEVPPRYVLYSGEGKTRYFDALLHGRLFLILPASNNSPQLNDN